MPQVETGQRVAVAKVHEAVNQRWIRSDDARKHLCSGNRFEAVGRRRRENHLAAFTYDQQPVAGQRDRAGAKLLLAPAYFSAPYVHRAQAWSEFLAPVIAVQDAIAVHARRIVIGQGLIRGLELG